MLFLACTRVQPDPVGQDSAEGFVAGEELVFGAVTSALDNTKAGFEDGSYHYVSDNYDFNVTMLEGSNSSLGTATYSFPESSQDPYGALEFSDASRKPLLWYYLETPYAFRADAGTLHVEADQKSRKNFLRQDKMSGYAGYPDVDHDQPCYMTARQWYNKNKEVMGLTETSSFYKRVPLYVKHQRAKISVILKAGEGVVRDNLAYDPQHGIRNAENLVDASIYSYVNSSQQLDVAPYLDSAPVQYAVGDVQNSACFEAIVEPFNYLEGTNAKELKITTVSLSGMKFSFAASNDDRYKEWEKLDESKPEEAERKAELISALDACYNLTPGKHLVLEVTLSTATRKVLITAFVTDWDERIYSTVCDDNGTSGKPVVIKTQQDLYDFLIGPLNRSGKVAYIGPTNFALDATWNPDGDATHPAMILNATLNAASAQLTTVNRIFKEVHGQFVNAHITFGNTTGSDSEKTPVSDVVESVVALENTGSIERVTVAPLNRLASATRAGLVVENMGSIINCSSAMPVYYSYADSGKPAGNVFVGGIAAVSKDQKENDVIKVYARIEGCKVTARVDGKTETEDNKVYGGGIVGYAESYVVNNSYEYGVTLSQPGSYFHNIVSEQSPAYTEVNFRSGNSWPTLAENPKAGTNANQGTLFHQVIDSAQELRMLVYDNRSTYNQYDNRYRVADSFTVSSDDWIANSEDKTMIGRMSDDLSINTPGNVFFELDGNGKEIRLVQGSGKFPGCAPMLFTNITGSVHDLTVICEDPIIYHKTSQGEDVVTSVAPLAYSVSKYNLGSDKGYSAGTIYNVNVRSQARTATTDVCVSAMAPSGLVVWAYGDALIRHCTSDVPVRVQVPEESGSQQTYFVGGIVNSACDASLEQCKYLWNGSGITPVGNVYYGGIVGGAHTPKMHDTDPSILITDCASKLAWTGSVRPSWGAIVGYAVYVKDNKQPQNAMREGCQGNWWDGDKDVRPMGRKVDLPDDNIIGKRNSVEPVWDESNYTE